MKHAELAPYVGQKVRATAVLTDRRRGDMTLVRDVRIEGAAFVTEHLWINLPKTALLLPDKTVITFIAFVDVYRRVDHSEDIGMLPTRLLEEVS